MLEELLTFVLHLEGGKVGTESGRERRRWWRGRGGGEGGGGKEGEGGGRGGGEGEEGEEEVEGEEE